MMLSVLASKPIDDPRIEESEAFEARAGELIGENAL
jgi:hypothetical protein